MRIADIRRVIDAANWCRTDFSGHTREEFLRANVAEQLGSHIAKLQALEIPPRFARDIEARDSAIEYAQRVIARWQALHADVAKAKGAAAAAAAGNQNPQPPVLTLVPSAPAPTPAPGVIESKPQFAIGTKFMTRDRFPKECTVTDILTTRNSRGEVVRIAYEAVHEFCGQMVTDHNVCQVTIARGLIAQPAVMQ